MRVSLAAQLRGAVARGDHPMWVAAQQVAARGLVALKFLLIARWLGPTSIGVVGITLLALAVSESLTDVGLAQAIVQAEDAPSRETYRSAWGFLVLRGLLISIALFGLSTTIANVFGAPEAASLVRWIALVPIVRNGASIGIARAQRQREFRGLSFVQAAASLVDISASLALVASGSGVLGVVWGALGAELVRTLLSHLVYPIALLPSFQRSGLGALLRFGKWIWGSNLIALALNQSDKAIVGVMLGPTALGLYQMAGKLSQLLIAEFSVAMAQYLFPTFSALNRESVAFAATAYRRAFNVAWTWSLGLATIGWVTAPPLVRLVLGDAWLQSVGILRVMVISMVFGALIAVLSSYLRAVGRPAVVTRVSGVQLLIFTLAAVLLGGRAGAIGIAAALALGTFSTTTLLLYSLGQRVPFGTGTVLSTAACIGAIIVSALFPGQVILVAALFLLLYTPAAVLALRAA